MASRYALVPESWLTHNKSDSLNHKKDLPTSVNKEIIVTEANDAQDKINIDVDSLANFIPKAYRHKGKLLLSFIEPTITLNSRQRVVYEDGTVGSHILDLLRYFLSPFKTERPLDSKLFEQLINKSSAPDSVMSNYRRRHARQWVSY